MRDKNFKFSEITPEIIKLSEKSQSKSIIEKKLYEKYNVKRGLRDRKGVGVLTGLTEISDVNGGKTVKGTRIDIEGELRYRGIPIQELCKGFLDDDRFGFEEITYLLVIGSLPTRDELAEFKSLLGKYRNLPLNFVRDIIMKAPSLDIMNTMQRSVLTMYSYDETPDDISLPNVLRQSMQLIAILPMVVAYGYHACKHYYEGSSFFIHPPQPELSTAENILYMFRADSKYTRLEAKLLDLALVLHAEHGGGNNSTFTTHVVSSSGTDTYSSVVASLASLKGPRHGGANVKAANMLEDMKKNVKDWKDRDEVKAYINKILDGEAFDGSGLLYGIGHAIYSVSDPRSVIFKKFTAKLSEEKGLTDEFEFYSLIEELAPALVKEKRNTKKEICANIDFYSGFVYSMLGIPGELFTPLFAVSRIAGWSAHRLEEIINDGKLIRPAYMGVHPHSDYTKLEDR